MTSYLRNLFAYFDNVIHPAGGTPSNSEKRRRRSTRSNGSASSPESSNLRGPKKADKSRLNPAP